MQDSDDLKEINGPQCWYVTEADPGGLKKAMWQEIATEFHCKASSTWLSCDDWRWKSFYTQRPGEKGMHFAVELHSGSEKLRRDTTMRMQRSRTKEDEHKTTKTSRLGELETGE